MTRQEVHRFLYGNDNDVDEVVLGEGFLGVLKQNFHDAEKMSIVYSDEIDYGVDEVKKHYSCVLPYYFMNILALYTDLASYEDLTSYRVENLFDEVCVIESNDGSMIYSGTFYELLMKVAEFTEIYYADLSATPSQWLSVSTFPRVDGECGYYDGRELFFEDMSIEPPAMTVFAPIEENSYQYQEAVVPMCGFELAVLYPEFESIHGFCSYLDSGIEAYGVENNTPRAVLAVGAAICYYE